MYKQHPNILVSNEIMQHAQCIEDIRDCIQYKIIQDVFYQDIFQQYVHQNTLVSLWFCRATISWESGRIKAFHTANLAGVEDSIKLKDTIFYRANVLKSPIKYLGKDLFWQTLDLFQREWVVSVKIQPFFSTNSKKFYDKMVSIYADRIVDVFISSEDDIFLTLKKD